MIGELLTNFLTALVQTTHTALNAHTGHSRQQVPPHDNKCRKERCFPLMCFGNAQVCYITAFSHSFGPWVVVNEKDGYLDLLVMRSQGHLSSTPHFS